jgi:pyrroline-5-carboxylate reductase
LTVCAIWRQLPRPWGESPETLESEVEAYAVLTAMGPTYFWFQWQQLRVLAAEWGLAPAECDHALSAMLHGAMELLLASGRSYDEVVDSIPVRPLEGDEDQFKAVLSEKLRAIHQKFQPAASKGTGQRQAARPR